MCCFSRPVAHVSSTRIYARPLGEGRQALVYAMRFAAAEPLAMVLPLPVPRGAGDDGARFVDLSRCAAFFDTLATRWAPELQGLSRGAPQPAAAKLVVHRVGAFDASFVPSIPDFARLDARFRLDDAVWGRLGDYHDWGFAVFQLHATRPAGIAGWFGRSPPTDVHPMALVFPTRAPERVFFPTVHVHDGHVAATATFDHTLYLQVAGRPRRFGAALPLSWQPSDGPLGPIPGAPPELLDASDIGFRASIHGEAPNRDVWVPVGARPTAALVERIAISRLGPAALPLLAGLPALPGLDPAEAALAAVRASPDLSALAVAVRGWSRDAHDAAISPAVTAWRRSGARYSPEEGARRAEADEVAWEGWLSEGG